jgi:hypothetical protein
VQRTRTLAQAQGMAGTPWRQPQARRKEVITMVISIPLFVIVGVIVYVAWRYMGLRVWQMLASVTLGVLFAATPAGPHITALLSGLVQWLSKP